SGARAPPHQRSLQAHLQMCEECAREHQEWTGAIEQLAAAGDVPVPRHFFVYSEPARRIWNWPAWSLGGWKVAVAATSAALLLLAVLVGSNFQARADGGVYTFSFGKPLPVSAPANPAVDVAALRQQILEQVQVELDRQRSAWLRDVWQELARAGNALTGRQQQRLHVALADMEARLNQRVGQTGTNLQAGWNQSLADLYQTLQIQRRQDRVALERLDHLILQGEMKRSETEAVVDTLLQVAEFKLK
ncbi:MAG: hypothetical protein ACR2L2_01135, partial [Acidobacteriota bacterium]